jgi:hypothetical protein
MENEKTYVTVADKVVDKLIGRKLDTYYSQSEDFVILHELTVTITLHEYRDLIKSKASKDTEIQTLNIEKAKLREELETYKTENDLLTRKIMRMEQPDIHDDKAEEA